MKRAAYVGIILLLAGIAWYTVHRERRGGEGNNDAPVLPASVEEFKQQPGGASTVEAGEFLIGLAKDGKLPGFSKGEHGSMQAGNFNPNEDASSGSARENYPVSRAVHFSKEGDASNYFYVVVRESAGSEWRLQKAWRADSEGQVVENYSVQ